MKRLPVENILVKTLHDLILCEPFFSRAEKIAGHSRVVHTPNAFGPTMAPPVFIDTHLPTVRDNS
jgi:hypothetical protein